MYAKISSKFNTNTQKLLYNGEPNVLGAILDLKNFKHINWLECSYSNLGINSEINLENLPVSLEIIHFEMYKEPKIIGNTTNWVI